MATPTDRRLIEDYLPLDDLNAVASTEKFHPRRYVELIHYWPARRPITASRAAVYAALVPAPRNEAEREDAASFVARLAAYRPAEQVVSEAGKRIRALHGGRAPKVLDLFAGGGAIPLEAARLGCESHALDYNPVAHLIELCTLVYPQQFGDTLADDFERWSEIILERMRHDAGDLYPPVPIAETDDVAMQRQLFGTREPQTTRQAEPVAYVWARTVPCRRPGCAAPVPLVRQAWLRKKGGAVAAIPRIEDGNRLCWDIVSGSSAGEVSRQTEQTGAGQAICVACHTPAPAAHVKEMADAGRMGESLAAVVVKMVGRPRRAPGNGRNKRRRWPKLYLSPDAAAVPSAEEIEERLVALERELRCRRPDEMLQGKLRDQLPGYGVEHYHELFTPRQLLVLFILVKHIRSAHREMLDEGVSEERAQALTTYFTMVFDRLVITFNKFARWRSGLQKTEGVFDRQALKMTYDFSEINFLADTQGCLPFAFERISFSIRKLTGIGSPSVVYARQRGKAALRRRDVRRGDH